MKKKLCIRQIFLEPEGLDDPTVYPNGISTSLPRDVQDEFIRQIEGLEHVEILEYGYAIEYDYVDPRELNATLELKKIKLDGDLTEDKEKCLGPPLSSKFRGGPKACLI